MLPVLLLPELYVTGDGRRCPDHFSPVGLNLFIVANCALHIKPLINNFQPCYLKSMCLLLSCYHLLTNVRIYTSGVPPYQKKGDISWSK